MANWDQSIGTYKVGTNIMERIYWNEYNGNNWNILERILDCFDTNAKLIVKLWNEYWIRWIGWICWIG